MAKRTVKPRAAKTESAAETHSAAAQPVAAATDRKTPRRGKATGSTGPDENVRVRAYYRFLERGGGPGEALNDWFEAERELNRK